MNKVLYIHIKYKYALGTALGRSLVPKHVPVYLFYKQSDVKKYGTYVYYVQYITGEKRELGMDENVYFADEDKYALYDEEVYEAI